MVSHQITDYKWYNLVMLQWFVDKEVAERVMRGGDLIEEQEVESRPEKIPRKCLDENVCISHIKKLFHLMVGEFL